MRGALLSIKPRYAERILAGDKTVELRRRVPACRPGDIVVVYESSPTMAIVGVARVSDVECRAPSSLWESVKTTAGVTRSEFRSYFTGSKSAYAIHLSDVHSLRKPLHLREIQDSFPEFRPPQSWCYLQSLPTALLSGIRRRARLHS